MNHQTRGCGLSEGVKYLSVAESLRFVQGTTVEEGPGPVAVPGRRRTRGGTGDGGAETEGTTPEDVRDWTKRGSQEGHKLQFSSQSVQGRGPGTPGFVPFLEG